MKHAQLTAEGLFLLSALAQCETRIFILPNETRDDRGGSAQQKLNLRARAVIRAQPNDLWR